MNRLGRLLRRVEPAVLPPSRVTLGKTTGQLIMLRGRCKCDSPFCRGSASRQSFGDNWISKLKPHTATLRPLTPLSMADQCQFRALSCIASASNAAAQSDPSEPSGSPVWQRILTFVIKLAAGLSLLSITLLALLPAIISSTTGLHTVLGLANRFIPGQLAVEKVCSAVLKLTICRNKALPALISCLH